MRRIRRVLAVLAISLFCTGGILLVLSHAWVAEDAYITFRVVDNAVNGFGFRWNVDERVEVYTNPLWMLLHVPLHAVYPDIFRTTILVSILFTILAVCFASRLAPGTGTGRFLCLISALMLSRTLVEFSTSGLENPLSHLLAAAFIWILLRKAREPSPSGWFWPFLVMSLACLNRMDTILFYLPVMIYLLRSRPRDLRWKHVLAGISPLVVWKLFSFVYYGFPFPNTAYAKLATGIDRLTYVKHGAFYLLDLARRDTPSFVLLLAAVVMSARILLRKVGGIRPPPRDVILAWCGLGAALYGIYVISVGGDFMAGRFWSLPVFVSALVLYGAGAARLSARRLAVIGALLFVSRLTTYWTEPAGVESGGRIEKAWHSIDDERLKYSAGHALFSVHRIQLFRFSIPVVSSHPELVMWHAVGLAPFNCGPNSRVIDGLGLADPLLARLPPLAGRRFYVGHFTRGIPLGYVEARLYGTSDLTNHDLSAYYNRLRLITSGPIFDPARLATVLRFNLGAYDSMKETYLASGEPFNDIRSGASFARETGK